MQAVTITSTGTQNALDALASLPLGIFQPTVAAVMIRCNNASALTINGLLAPNEYSYNADYNSTKQWPAYIFCAVNASITFSHLSGSATASRQLFCDAEDSVSILAGESLRVVYDPTSLLWRLISAS